MDRRFPKCSTLRRSSTTSPTHHTKEQDIDNYDLIVVGFGLAGASAAIAAAEHGASVLVVDRDHGGGASALSGGVVYAGGGTPYQIAAGFEDTPENMFNYLKLEVGDAVDEDTLRQFCNESVVRLAWLEKHGAKFNSSFCPYKTSYPTDKHYLYFSGNEQAYPYREHAKPIPRGHRSFQPGLDAGRTLWQALSKSAKELGVLFQPLSRVERLILENGRLTGVEYRTIRESSQAFAQHRRLSQRRTQTRLFLPQMAQRYNARAEALFKQSAEHRTAHAKAVVLSAGGFAFNHMMRKQFLPAYGNVAPLGTEGDDGSGIKLGQTAGGAVSQMSKMSAWRFLSPPDTFVRGVAVGANGERIAPEDLYGATFAELLIHRFDGRGYLILDSRMWAKAKAQLNEQADWPMKIRPLAQLLFAHRKGQTIGALASKIGVPADAIQKTIDAYNRGIATQSGDPARKSREYCMPTIHPPFYAIDISIRRSGLFSVHGITLGGLLVEGSTGLVLDDSGKTIPGLYAAGRNAVGICSNSYVSGLSLADCVFSGKRAGEHAATVARRLAPQGVSSLA